MRFFQPFAARLAILVGLASLTLVPTRAGAQQQEYPVKAAFLFNFAKFIDWPGSSSSPIVIGIVGHDPFGKTLDEVVAGKNINGRKIVVKRLSWSDPLDCQMLFVSAKEAGNFEKLSPLRRKPVVVVGESAGFAKSYGTINFVIANSRVAFEINANAAKGAGLNISSRLLQLAKIVD